MNFTNSEKGIGIRHGTIVWSMEPSTCSNYVLIKDSKTNWTLKLRLPISCVCFSGQLVINSACVINIFLRNVFGADS